MRTSAEESDRNLTAFQHCNNIYFRACRQLGAGEKLRVWYSEDYLHRLHAISRENIDHHLEAGELGLLGERQPSNTSSFPAEPIIPDLKTWESLPSFQTDLKPRKPSEEPDGPPSAKKKKIDLIFKDVLEASLEGSGGVKPPSSPPPECKTAPRPSGLDSAEGPFSVLRPKVEKEEERWSVEEASTSFCPNCVRLKRRILELEEELSRLKGDRRDGPPDGGPAEPQQAAPQPQQGPMEDLQGRKTQGGVVRSFQVSTEAL